MNILLIPDKFKSSLTAKEVIEALKKGITKFNSKIIIYEAVVSDGGDGFLDAIAENDAVEFVEMPSVDPLGRKMMSKYALNGLEKIAYIELANTSGLALLPETDRNVLKTSTFGTGLQIKHAIGKGARKIFIGLGGSATNDGGIGIASALGYEFLDESGKNLSPIGENLSLISKIKSPLETRYEKVEFYAVNDVNNPLFGDMGAAKIYGRQKGGDENAIDELDKGLRNLHKVVQSQLGFNLAHGAGAGAAGGTAYGLRIFLDANFVSGIEFILNKNNILNYFEKNEIDLIITGEGKIDDQTNFGKLVKGVAQLAEKYKIPVIGVCGNLSMNRYTIEQLGLQKVYALAKEGKSLAYNMENAASLLENIAFKIIEKYGPIRS